MEIELVWFVLTLCAAGAIAGITSGLFGNGGGFVVVPALSIVFPFFVPDSDEIVKVAIGTSLASIVVSSLRSVIAHKAIPVLAVLKLSLQQVFSSTLFTFYFPILSSDQVCIFPCLKALEGPH